MNAYTSERALFAANALVYLAIAFGTLSFWSNAFASGPVEKAPVEWLVAALLTVAMLSVSYLLSCVVVRFAEAREKKADWTAGMVIGLGLVLTFIEGGMTHQGLAWLDANVDLGPDWALWVVSFGLSAFNVLSLYTFAREIKKAERPETSAAKLLALKSAEVRRNAA